MSTTITTRRAPRARPGATIPEALAEQLRHASDARDQLILIAEHERRAIERSVTPIVGATNAEDVVSEVIVQHLERHLVQPEWTYDDGESYHRMRASLRRAARNRAIDVYRRKRQVERLLDESALTASAEGAQDERTALVASLDGAALYDAFRRLDPRDATVLRIKLVEGGTFKVLAAHLGVASPNAAHKHYLRAIKAAQRVLDRYGNGDYCRDYGPYLGLAVQEESADDDLPLTAVVGDARAREIALHVFGDPREPNDAGCHACQTAVRRERAAIGAFLPPPTLAAPAGGVVSGIAGGLRDGWDWAAGWLAALAGGGTMGPAAGGLTAKGAALVAAAAVAVTGPVLVGGGPGEPAGRTPDRIAAASALTPVPVDRRPPTRSRARVSQAVRSRRAPSAHTKPAQTTTRRDAAPARRIERHGPTSPPPGAAREFTPGPPG